MVRLRCPICGWEQKGDSPTVCARDSCGVGLLRTENRLRPRTFQLVNHFSLCVLPFSFADPEGQPVLDRLLASSRWKERIFSLSNAADVERTEYFLPYIRRFLFPGLDKAAPRSAKEGTCWHFDFDLARLGTVTPAGLPLELHAHDNRKNLDYLYPLMLEKVELLVFRYRVGFLIFQYQNSETGATLFDQMDALVYLRTLAPLYPGFQMPDLAAGPHRYRMPGLLRYLLAEFAADPVPPAPQEVRAAAPLPVKPIYDDRMMVYTFSCLDRDTILEDVERSDALLRRAAILSFNPESTTRPHDAPRTRGKDDWLQERRQGFSKDGGMLVVFDTDRFHNRFLGVYQRTYYFDIFILAALQRVTLLTLFESFSDIQTLITGSSASRKLLRRVRRDLLLFKNQCWFSQITNRERGLVLWRRWKKVFETPTLLREVNDQSEELDTYLRARHRERIEWLVKLGSFLAAAIPIVYGLERFLGTGEWVSNLRLVLIPALILGTAIFGWFVVVRQSEDA
jgi:hypothetical protein